MVKFYSSDHLVIDMCTREFNWRLVQPIDADVIVLGGGADVHPEMYGEKNVASLTDRARDRIDLSLCNLAREHGKYLIGICRGAQFINVFEGGTLWQDVTGHATGDTHYTYYDGTDYEVTSTHHQMIKNVPDHGTVICEAEEVECRVLCPDRGEYTICYEQIESVVYQNKMSEPFALAFQPHPEYGGVDDTLTLFMILIEEWFPELDTWNAE